MQCKLWNPTWIGTWSAVILLYVNDFHCCSDIFDFHLCADDADLFYKSEFLTILEKNINAKLNNIHIWLCAKLSYHLI